MLLSFLSLIFLGWVVALGEKGGSIDERGGIDKSQAVMLVSDFKDESDAACDSFS